MAELKRDNVNRFQGVVVLQADLGLPVGSVVRLSRVVEHDIDCSERDPSQMADPHLGDAVGDAIMDAALAGYAICDAGVGSTTSLLLAEDGDYLEHEGFHYELEVG